MKKRLILIITFLFIAVTIGVAIYIRDNNLDIRDKAAEGDFNISEYRGMARFGAGRLTEAFQTEDVLEEYNDYKFGWYHNWMAKGDYFGDGEFPVEIPESLDFYGLIGGYNPGETVCPDILKSQIERFTDGDVIWVGNEIGWDDDRDPTTYARQYKSWYDCVKSVNPNIRVAPGANPGHPTFDYSTERITGWQISNDPQGRWNPNKLINYMEYLEYAKSDYIIRYGEEMPIDAYVIHVYPCGGGNCLDVNFVEDQIRIFRSYMKNTGEERLHLYIKETNVVIGGKYDDEQRDAIFNLYDLFLNLKDSEIGNPNDNNRLVQRWAWWWMAANPGVDYLYNVQCHLYECDPFYNSDGTIKNASTHDCRTKRIETLLAEYHKQYVNQVWNTYDSQPPNNPDIIYNLSGNTAIVSYSAEDNGRINNYEISVGSTSGETDIMLWTSTDMQTSFTINDAVDKYINVK